LDSRLLAGIKRAGYDTPTPIQTQAVPAALDGRDLIGIAQILLDGNPLLVNQLSLVDDDQPHAVQVVMG
jgi:ATP-dependent RNA helicase RhlE